ncbi:hypothetical protein Trydic_g16331 [Trypoxylus dichotomus]
MEKDCFITAVQSLRKPQDKKKLLQILVLIRKGIDDSPTELQSILSESSTIKNLIGCLQLENTTILDVTLSILGNCCVDLNFARSAAKLNILHYLDRLLEKFNKDSITGRVFRIVGNLCESICSAAIISKEPSLINKVIGILKKVCDDDVNAAQQPSVATVLMAIRTLRKLLKRSTLKSLIVDHGVLDAVGAVLIKYVEQLEVNNNQHVIEEILKLLHIYSRHWHPNTIRSLKNTEKGDALLYLAKLITLYPTRVTKIIVNLSRYCSLKSDLPVSDIWQRLTEKVMSNINERAHMEYLSNMRKLIDNPSNRAQMKLGDSISQLITLLKNFSTCTDYSLECSALILSILNKTQNDDALVAKQISSDIINILVAKLEWVGASSTLAALPHHIKRKRKRRYSDISDSKNLKLFLDSEFYNSSSSLVTAIEDGCASSSDLSEISSDGPFSPGSAANAEDLSDSDNYSPVCSDAEDTEINSLPSLSTMDAERVTPSDEDYVVSFNCQIKHKILYEINSLLWRYTNIIPPAMDLGSPKLLTALINVALANRTSPWPQQLITVILRKPDYLIPLMQTNFVQMVYDLTKTIHDDKSCSSCNHICNTGIMVLNTFTKTAESGAGKGDIAHTLLRGNAQVKDNIVVAIPYVIRNKNLIGRLLIDCGGLDVLLNLIERKSDIQQNSIKGLCVLAIHQLKIKNPIHNQPQKQLCDLDITNYSLPVTCSNVVIFKLDDGDVVSADRDFLSDKSDYFNRLLSGSFKESEQSEITLQNISSKSLKLLLRLLHCNIASLGIANLDLDTLLDLLEITERYLLIELNVYLAGCVEQLHMSNKTVPLIYQWSIESGTNILRVETIAFALVADILDVDRIRMFHDLFNLGYYRQLKDDIQKLLIRFLK